jgi:ubiquitin conjugation factor E4 B
VLASLPTTSVFSFLVSAWKRAAAAQSALSKRKHPPLDAQRAGGALSALRELLVSYAGLALQDPLMFPAPAGADPATLGAPELVPPLLALSALAGPLGAAPQDALLAPAEVGPFLADLSARFLPAGELPGVLGPVFTALLGVPALRDPGGLVAPDAAWRRVLAALDALLAVRGAPDVLTGLPAWCPDVAPGAFEHAALLGPLLRLGTFAPEWPALAATYFGAPDARTRADVDASFASLRGTLKSVQNGLFGVVNTLVRAGATSRGRVLAFFGAVVRLNRRRAGMQVEASSVASDSFMLNALVLLLRLAEPFMDSAYSKLGRVDAHYFARSTLIDLGDETRVCATQDEARAWEAKVREEEKGAPPPNFVSDVFWLAGAVLHLGLLQTGARLDADARHHEDLRAHVAQIEGDDSWRAAPWRARTEAALAAAKKQRAELGAAQLAARAALEDGEVAFRALGFVNFVSTWILRLVDPAGAHPAPSVALPLPKDAPWAFRALPEYMFDDVVGTLRFYSRWAPQALALAGKGEVVVFALAFLTSTQYVTNPFLKSRLIEVRARSWRGAQRGLTPATGRSSRRARARTTAGTRRAATAARSRRRCSRTRSRRST